MVMEAGQNSSGYNAYQPGEKTKFDEILFGQNVDEDFSENINSSNSTNSTCNNEYCVTDEEYLDMIQDYIFPTTFEWILITLYIVVFTVGLIGNFLVCFVVWRNNHMRTVTNLFIVNLSLADFLVILICLPPTVLGDVTETWYMGSVMCKIVKYIQVRVSPIVRYYLSFRIILQTARFYGDCLTQSPSWKHQSPQCI